jgi:hypothetical protein
MVIDIKAIRALAFKAIPRRLAAIAGLATLLDQIRMGDAIANATHEHAARLICFWTD